MKQRIDWVNALFLTLSPIVATLGLIWRLYEGIPLATWLLALFMALATGLSITAGYHRLFSHKTYEAKGIVRFILLLFGAASLQNSTLKWCSDHRRHHQFVDKENDPYSIKKGFWHAHIGWIFMKPEEKPTYENVPDLMTDPLVRFQHRFYLPIAILVSFGLPTLVASLWGDPLGGFFLAGFARIVFNHQVTFAINSVAHFVGTQPYSEKDSSKDNWFLAFLTYGEGFHNFHHTFQTDYRNGYRAHHWDPAKWIISSLAWLKLAKNLRRTPKEKIVLTRLQMEEKRLLAKAKSEASELITTTRQRLEEAYLRFMTLKNEYQQLKKVQLDTQVLKIKQELENAKVSLKEATLKWQELCRNFGDQSVTI